MLAVHAGVFGAGKTGVLLLPVLGALLAIGVLPKHYRSVLVEGDTWVVMLVYSITFGGFVGMSSYVTTLLVSLYQLPKLEAGLFMSLLAFTGALVRPIGGLIATGFRCARLSCCSPESLRATLRSPRGCHRCRPGLCCWWSPTCVSGSAMVRRSNWCRNAGRVRPG